jgi:hypothetical protein
MQAFRCRRRRRIRAQFTVPAMVAGTVASDERVQRMGGRAAGNG